MMIVETTRLYLRKLTWEDRQDLCDILQDRACMYAYEHAFSNDEVDQWLSNQLRRYHEDGFGLWAVIRKEDHAFLGQCGLSLQMVEGKQLLEIGYLFKRIYWHQGYAVEAAIACKEYAFQTLQAASVCSIIRDTNTSSKKVALRNGMQKVHTIVKHYYGFMMPHDIYLIENS